jgi:DNA-binding CsgD family transcriptional regulator
MKELLLTIFSLFALQAFGIGVPEVINYPIKKTGAGTQTWMIDFSDQSMGYFANNDGLFEFDGTQWTLYQLPNASIVRSVLCKSDTIFIGGFNEFGFFAPNAIGDMEYTSLSRLLEEEYKDFGEIWKIHRLANGKLIFQSFSQLMIYKGSEIKTIQAKESFHFSYCVEDRIFVNDLKEGILYLENELLQPLPGAEPLKGELIWGMSPIVNRGILISTSQNEVYLWRNKQLELWDNPAAKILKANQIQTSLALDEYTIVFGTVQNGILIADWTGKVLQHVNLEKGLQNNTVLSMKKDNFDNLWLGLDNGIDYVKINSPLSYLGNAYNLSASYCAQIYKGRIYCGTNRGLFYQELSRLDHPFGENSFQLVEGTEGQVWSLKLIDEQLLIGHNLGIFSLNALDELKKISYIQGGWTFANIPKREDYLIVGTYSGLSILKKNNDNQWVFGHTIKGYKESSRFLAFENENTIWIGHPYKGLYRIKLSPDYRNANSIELYSEAQGLPSTKDLSVFALMDKSLVFTSGKGIYRFDPQEKIFKEDKQTLEYLKPSINILQSFEKSIWYFGLEDMGVLKLNEEGTYTDIALPFKELKNTSNKWFQFVYTSDESEVFIGHNSGLVHYDASFIKDYKKTYHSKIRSVKLLGSEDAIKCELQANPKLKKYSIPYHQNHFQINYSSLEFPSIGNLQYYTFMDGFDENWLKGSKENFRQFTNLNPGLYAFSIKSLNPYGVESSTDKILIEILPPWYLSKRAYATYFFIFILSIALVFYSIQKKIQSNQLKIKEEQAQLFKEKENKLKIETLEAEKEIAQLTNEKLILEKIQKDKELANTTMEIIQKSKILTQLKEELKSIKKDKNPVAIQNAINTVIKRIDKNIDSENQWEVFERHFEDVHEAFLKRLKENYPDLTPRELKLCAYLRLNISSKEIAELMNISVRGVETGRYRLRKKLNLRQDSNLTEFILAY